MEAAQKISTDILTTSMNNAGLRPQIPAAQHSHRVHLGMLYDDILRRLSNLPGSDLRSHNDQRRDNLAQRLAAP